MTEQINASDYKITDSKTFVKIRYTVRVENGPVIKGGTELEVMDFITGFGQVIRGLELRLIGHGVGERLSFTVPAEEAFGMRHPELLIEKSTSEFHFPPGFVPYAGMEISILTGSEDGPDTALIREVKEETIVIDCNHPLAGAPLRYELEIIEARPAKDTDMCAEWEEKSGDGSCSSCGPQTMILGGDDA